jgi:hypothetical protein
MNITAIVAGVLMARREGLTDPAAGIRSGIAASVLSGGTGISTAGLIVAQRVAQDEAAAQRAAAPPPPAASPQPPEQRAVPNVSPVTAHEAEATLVQAGFAVEVQMVDGSQKFPVGTVISQTPAAGNPAPPGTVIRLQAAAPHAQVSVERVVGESPATEEAASAPGGGASC